MIKNRSIAGVLVLCFITCGIYGIVWMYLTRTELKEATHKSSINPGLEILLSILCFPYYYYWMHKASQDIYETGKSYQVCLADNALLNMILLFLGLGIVSILIMQNDLNKIADSNVQVI